MDFHQSSRRPSVFGRVANFIRRRLLNRIFTKEWNGPILESILQRAQSTSLFPPERLDEYNRVIQTKLRITKPLTFMANGSFGLIFSTEQFTRKRKVKVVALKAVIVPNNDSKPLEQQLLEFSKKVRNELKISAELKHPNIVRTISFVELLHEEVNLPKAFLFTMEQMQCSVYNLLEIPNRHQLQLYHLWSIVGQIGDALMFLHHHQIGHNDIKSPNILAILVPFATPADSLTHCFNKYKVGDFGCAKSYSFPSNDYSRECFEPTGGTILYFPPERKRSTARHRLPYNPYLGDSYAFGVTLVSLIYGTERVVDEMVSRNNDIHSFWLSEFDTLCPQAKDVKGMRSWHHQKEKFDAIASLLEPDWKKRAFINDDFIERFDR